MKLSKNNEKVISALKARKLTYLIKPFKRMVELDQLDIITVHKMTWKVIMRETHSNNISVRDFEQLMLSYLTHFGIITVKKKRKDVRESKERVKSYRKDKKALGYKQLSVLVSQRDLGALKCFKDDRGMTYQEVLSYMISKLPVKITKL